MKRLSSALVVALAVAVPAAALADQPTSTDQNNAAKECKALRKAMGDVNFTKAYGTNKNGKNAYGKCVSKKAREEATERSDATKNAAKQCKAEQADSNFAATHDGKTFDQFYGTNKNGNNAYGKCVSQKAKANKQKADEQDQAVINASRTCRTEQKADPAAFKNKYGTNTNKSNAFGKCVSKTAKAQNGS
jgi:hypothetical protein